MEDMGNYGYTLFRTIPVGRNKKAYDGLTKYIAADHTQ